MKTPLFTIVSFLLLITEFPKILGSFSTFPKIDLLKNNFKSLPSISPFSKSTKASFKIKLFLFISVKFKSNTFAFFYLGLN